MAFIGDPASRLPRAACSIIDQTCQEGEAFMLRFSKYLIFGFPLYAIPQSMLADDLSHRQVDPTFLHRYIPDVQPKASDVTTETCVYKPLFGAGDSASGVLKGVVRFGEITVMSGGKCKAVTYPAEEQALVIMDGGGTLQ